MVCYASSVGIGCMLFHSFDYRDNKRVCNESADDNLCKTKWRPMATFAATGTRADIDDLRRTMAALGTRLSILRERYGKWFILLRRGNFCHDTCRA